jgi:uncharacterized protein (TIGR02271 family)
MSESQPADVVPLVKEELRIDKHTVVTGKVRVRSVVETVEEVARATLEGEHVEVTRVPIDREVDAVPQVRSEDGTVIVPVVEEIMVVEKRLVLKEELHIRRIATRENVEVPVTLRKERAVIERVSVGPNLHQDEESER